MLKYSYLIFREEKIQMHLFWQFINALECIWQLL